MRQIVGVAEMKISPNQGDVLVTHGLGSCLGIAVHDAVAKVGGMLHVMMPASSANVQKAKANPWMFVDTGVPALLRAMEEAGANRRRWRIKVVGGASVNQDDHFEIGKRNYIALKKLLWKNGVFIDAEDVGGAMARTLYLEVGSGKTWLTSNGEQREL